MNIQARMGMLLQAAPHLEARKDLVSAYDRLVGLESHQMGSIYKFMALVDKKQKSLYPFSK